jgi:hypothetical protein
MPRGSKPGERRGGRTKGTQNKATPEIREYARQLLNGPAYCAKLEELLVSGRLPAPIWALLYQYGYGKPVEYIEHSGQIELPVRVVHEYHAENARQ